MQRKAKSQKYEILPAFGSGQSKVPPDLSPLTLLSPLTANNSVEILDQDLQSSVQNNVNFSVNPNIDHNISSNVCSNSSNTFTLNTVPVFYNNSDNVVLNQLSSSESKEQIHEKVNIKDELRLWVVKNNIKANHVSELLHILKPYILQLPCDSRTLMETPRQCANFLELNNGKMIHFGRRENIEQRLNNFALQTTKILLQINIDGVPLFKSSCLELYPILALSKTLKNSAPFTVGVFCGTGKPEPLSTFLCNFIEEVKLLRTNGIVIKGTIVTVDIDFFICDAPVRSFLKQTLGHNSSQGCDRCNIKGKFENHVMNFSESRIISHSRKLDSDFYLPNSKSYIKSKSPLLELQIKLISQFPIDPMHLIYLGVVKRMLLKYYIEGKNKQQKLSRGNLKSINDKSKIISQHVTSDFARKPRSLFEIKRWKATEFKLFIIYTCPILLHNAVHS